MNSGGHNMTIFQILKADHKKVSALLEKLEKTTEEKAEQREKLFAQFRTEMLTHAKAEEKAVYSHLKSEEKTKDITLEAYEEHALVEHLISQLDALDKSDETWTAKMTVLKEMIEHHVEEEEGDMFKKMKKTFDSNELESMAKEMTVLKRRLKLAPVASQPIKQKRFA
jgi:hemerythrin superfamily protein